jgi:uncharacterized membrane protein YgcG
MKDMFTRITVLLLATLLVLPLGSAIAEDDKKKTYSQQELDQMMAPIALYPDSLLSQILMASTYPGDVAEAVEWSKKNTKKTGDDAVKAVQKKSWDPSVMSLVAFPSVLDMMGQKPDWVQTLGDAFLANPDGVMDTVQSLRKKAKDEGNLKTTKEQTVKTEDSSDPQIIIIEPSDPEVIYVPTYNPTIIYGTWWWPSYYPYYYRPVGYGFGTGIVTGIGFGIGIGITNALWGGFNWRHHSVDINVNRHNNINVKSNRINASSRNSTWKHNSNNVNSIKRTNNNQINKQKASNKISGSENRNEFRGRDADREKAKASLESRGVDPTKGRQELKGSGGSKARDTVSKANRDFDSGKMSNFDSSKVSKNLGSAKPSNMDTGKLSNIDSSRKSDFSSKKSSFNDNAFSDVGNARSSQNNISRGTSSNRSFQSSGGFSRSGGGGMSRGGGGMSRGGGGGGRRR